MATDHVTEVIDLFGRTVGPRPLALDAELAVVIPTRDESATAARARLAMGHHGVVLERSCRSVGEARAVGAVLAMQHLAPTPLEHAWLASTDADTTVPPSWIHRQLVVARSGVAAVAGIVELVDADDTLREAFDRRYHSTVDRSSHPHVHGANLGVRGDALSSVGGWAGLVSGEDRELWDRLGEAGHLRLHDPDLVVSTSSRTVGRAPGGFAADLGRLRPREHSLSALSG